MYILPDASSEPRRNQRKNTIASSPKDKIKFITYNVWSNELIERHDPDVIFLQEVTEHIFSLFQEAPWRTQYKTFSFKDKKKSVSWLDASQVQTEYACLLLSKLAAEEVVYHAPPSPQRYLSSPQSSPRSPPRVPDASEIRRTVAGPLPPDLLSNWVYEPTSTEGPYARLLWDGNPRVRAATCRLAAATPSDVRSMHRRGRAGLFLEHFDVNGCRNVVLGGDLSWDDDLDGPFPVAGPGRRGWVDAWCERRSGEAGGAGGWTYDAVANPMLSGRMPERKRPDRFICKLTDFRLDNIELIGVEPITGVTRCDDKGNVLPVLPSNHFGLLLTIVNVSSE